MDALSCRTGLSRTCPIRPQRKVESFHGKNSYKILYHFVLLRLLLHHFILWESVWYKRHASATSSFVIPYTCFSSSFYLRMRAVLLMDPQKKESIYRTLNCFWCLCWGKLDKSTRLAGHKMRERGKRRVKESKLCKSCTVAVMSCCVSVASTEVCRIRRQ